MAKRWLSSGDWGGADRTMARALLMRGVRMAMAAVKVEELVDESRLFVEADLDRFPRDGNRYEILDGSLHVSPAPIDDHNDLGLSIAIALRAAAPTGWRVLYEAGVRCGDSNFIPDIAVLKPDTIRGVNWHDAEDFGLVGEIESASSRFYDRKTKPAYYAAAGIPVYWRVHPREGGPDLHVYE